MSSRREALLALGAATLLAACGRKQKLAAIPRGATVLAFGDSVTFGTGAAKGEDWPTQLGAATGWNVINGGVPGDTAEAGRARLPGLLETHRPALVLVEIGGNDFLRRRGQVAVMADIRAMLAAVRQSGARAVLIAVPELSLLGALTRRPSDAPIYAELGKEEGVPVIADVFADILGKPELCADQIHPNAAGYRQFANQLKAGLTALGLAA